MTGRRIGIVATGALIGYGLVPLFAGGFVSTSARRPPRSQPRRSRSRLFSSLLPSWSAFGRRAASGCGPRSPTRS